MPIAPGEVKQPVIIFATGERAICVDHIYIHKKGQTFLKADLLLTENMKARVGITEKDLNFDKYAGVYPSGVLIREYPESHRVILSDTPSDPWWLMATNFDGTKADLNKNTWWQGLLKILDKVEALEKAVNELSAENEALRRRNQILASNLLRYKKIDRQAFDTIEETAKLLREFGGMRKSSGIREI